VECRRFGRHSICWSRKRQRINSPSRRPCNSRPALGEDNCKRFATRLFYSSPKPETCCNTGSRARWTGTSASSAKTSSAAHDKRGESHWPKVKVEATVKPRSPNPPRRNRLLRHQQSRHLRPGIGWDGRRSHDGEIRTTTAAHKRAAQSAPCRLAFRNAGSSPIPPNLAPATHFADQAATAPRRHHGVHRLLPGQKRR
jgi:hypothetical protein